MNKTSYYGDNKTYYQADDFRAPWAAALTDGVLDDYVVSADSPANLAVSVSAGVANYAGYISRDDAPTAVEIPANTSGYNRIDLIVLDFDETNFATTLKDVQGIPSSSPVTPVVANNQIVLAQVLVGNNASVIDSNVITDKRAISTSKISPAEDDATISASALGALNTYMVLHKRGKIVTCGFGTINDGRSYNGTMTFAGIIPPAFRPIEMEPYTRAVDMTTGATLTFLFYPNGDLQIFWPTTNTYQYMRFGTFGGKHCSHECFFPNRVKNKGHPESTGCPSSYLCCFTPALLPAV